MARRFTYCGVLGLAAVFLFLEGSRANAAPIFSELDGCPGQVCTVTPVGGPIPVDPLGFTLDVRWGPDFIILNEDPGGHGLMQLVFSFTGVHDGTENMGTIDLLDAVGNPIAALNVSFDDVHALAGTARANYEIFGATPQFLHGFTLALSDGSGVDTLQWVQATIQPAAIARAPEPSGLLLLGTAAVVTICRRRARALVRQQAYYSASTLQA